VAAANRRWGGGNGRRARRGRGHPNAKRHSRTCDAWAATVETPHRLVGRGADRMRYGEPAQSGLGNAGGWADKWGRQQRGVTGKWTTQHARGEGGLMGQNGLAGPAREEKKYIFYFDIHFPINT
jgi:hypothetical protein